MKLHNLRSERWKLAEAANADVEAAAVAFKVLGRVEGEAEATEAAVAEGEVEEGEGGGGGDGRVQVMHKVTRPTARRRRPRRPPQAISGGCGGRSPPTAIFIFVPSPSQST